MPVAIELAVRRLWAPSRANVRSWLATGAYRGLAESKFMAYKQGKFCGWDYDMWHTTISLRWLVDMR